MVISHFSDWYYGIEVINNIFMIKKSIPMENMNTKRLKFLLRLVISIQYFIAIEANQYSNLDTIHSLRAQQLIATDLAEKYSHNTKIQNYFSCVQDFQYKWKTKFIFGPFHRFSIEGFRLS